MPPARRRTRCASNDMITYALRGCCLRQRKRYEVIRCALTQRRGEDRGVIRADARVIPRGVPARYRDHDDL